MAIEHYLTYQHNVQSYFRRHADKYTGIIVPISIAVSFSGGTYGFIRALCAKDQDKRYAIDPRTPLFQKSWDRANVRAPHKKTAGSLGPPFYPKGLERPLEPSDFKGKVLTTAVRQCLDYQLAFRTRKEATRKLEKYKKLLGVDELGELGEPQYLIPPYFQFESADDPWFDISLRAMKAACEFTAGVPIRPVVHMTSWTAVDKWKTILEVLASSSCTEVWLYPNNFHEHKASVDELKRYRSSVKKCDNAGVGTFALHGGYFAVLLGAFGLRGFANGIGYGEWRDSGYHRGGTAAVRIYLPRLHRYLDAPEAQHLLDEDPDHFATGSDLLSECAERKRNLGDLSQEESLEHFMECRSDEIAFVERRGIEAAKMELRTTLERLDGIGQLEREKYGSSLERWLEVLA